MNLIGSSASALKPLTSDNAYGSLRGASLVGTADISSSVTKR